MDFIYSRLNNNLIDINRLDKVTLLKCEKDGEPVEELKIGDYYLKFTVIDSDKVNYCSLADLNIESTDKRVDTLEERVTKDEEYFGERSLYKSTTNASKWESKEGSFTGYLGGSNETAVKAKVGLEFKGSSPYLPTYPTITGTYYAMAMEANSIIGSLNLTPINGTASPLFTFKGTGTVSMGERNIILADGWFDNNDTNITVKIPATSGTLCTLDEAVGSIDIEIDQDLKNITEIFLTDDQATLLTAYPKSLLALKKEVGYSYRYNYYYFTKLKDSYNSVGARFVSIYADEYSMLSADNLKICVAEIKFDYDKAQYKLALTHGNLGGGKIEDVKVNGTSVVTDKIANIEVPESTSIYIIRY